MNTLPTSSMGVCVYVCIYVQKNTERDTESTKNYQGKYFRLEYHFLQGDFFFFFTLFIFLGGGDFYRLMSPYLPTPPLRQDMTQGQLLNGV